MSDTSAPNYGGWGYGYASLVNANPQAQAFSAMLAALYNTSAPLYDPDQALRRDPDAWNKMMMDPVVRSAVNHRLAKVVRKHWVMDAGDASDEAAKLARFADGLVRKMKRFTTARRGLAKGAMQGYSVAFIEGRRQWDQVNGIFAEWWVPTGLRVLDKRQAILYPVTDKQGRFERTEIWLASADDGVHRRCPHPERLVFAVWDDEPERKGYGRGLGDTVYAALWIKQLVLREGLQGFEKWCQGIIDAGVDATAHATADMSAQDAAEQFLEAVKRMRQGGVIVHDARDEFKVVQPPSTGQDATHRWLEYLDAQITRLIVGSLLPTGVQSSEGSHARAEEEGESTDDLLDLDRQLLDEVITERLVRLVVDQNAANLVEQGCYGANVPQFRSVSDEHEDPEKFGRIVQFAQRVGLRLSRAELTRRFGLAVPTDQDDVIEPPSPSLIGSGFEGGGGEPGMEGGPSGFQEERVQRSLGGTFAPRTGTGDAAGSSVGG